MEERYVKQRFISGLNSNIRCIEILKWSELSSPVFWLNSNIRCIEIAKQNRKK